MKRRFVDVGDKQIHLRSAEGPVGGAAPPLVMIHQSPSSGMIFAPAMAAFARGRTVYAPDLPGYGESDRPDAPPGIRDYAAKLIEALSPLVSGPVDLLGYHTGASIAAEWADLHPAGVRRLVLIGAALFEPGVKEALFGTVWPSPAEQDGAHLKREWDLVMRNHKLPLPLASKAAIFHEMFRAGAAASWGGDAVGRHDLPVALARIHAPTLILETAEYLRGSGPRVAALIEGSEWRDWQHRGHGMFEACTEDVVSEIAAFLDA